MSQEFRTIMAAMDLLEYPSEPYDNWKGRSDREGEREEDIPMRACVPCEDGRHLACWAPLNKPHWYACLCRRRGHNG